MSLEEEQQQHSLGDDDDNEKGEEEATQEPASNANANDLLDPPRSCGERLRDWILRTLDRPFFQALGLVVLFLVIVDGAFFFFLLVGWQGMCTQPTRTDCEPRNWWYNFSVQLLNVLFTYMATASMPWRCTNFLHISGWSCPRRQNKPGHDLYGRPVADDVWFYVPLKKRLGITIVLLWNCLFQYANQVTRIYYYSFELQNEFPGSLWTNIFFGLSFLFAGIGGAWLAYETSLLRKQDPKKFGPGPVEMAQAFYAERFGKKADGGDGGNAGDDGEFAVATTTNEYDNEPKAADDTRTGGGASSADLEVAAANNETTAIQQVLVSSSKDNEHNADERCDSPSHADPTREPRRRSLVPTSRSSMRMFAM